MAQESRTSLHPNKSFRRKAATTIAGGSLAIGGVLGFGVAKIADNHAKAVAAVNALPYCETPATSAGIDSIVSKMGVDPGSAEVTVITEDGKLHDPYKDASMDFGRDLPETSTVAVNHVGIYACDAAGGVITRELTADLQQPTLASK